MTLAPSRALVCFSQTNLLAPASQRRYAIKPVLVIWQARSSCKRTFTNFEVSIFMPNAQRISRLGLVLGLLCNVWLVAQSAPPVAPVRDVTETYFGTSVTDPYRWLEKTSDAEVVAWMKAQNDYTRAVLAKIPGRNKLADRIKALDNAGTT